jgi:hypothetical protein
MQIIHRRPWVVPQWLEQQRCIDKMTMKCKHVVKAISSDKIDNKNTINSQHLNKNNNTRHSLGLVA